jgi:DNA helicase-2/ATP-dependent DNA helicase PcrA
MKGGSQSSKSTRSSSPAFDAAYTRLNDEQKKAVDTVEGPVMVVAGPGTGKTQVLALRVANILRTTQARPGNILCLTFSTAGATAMRERLRSLIGADAYSVTVSTIHGFCDALIRKNPAIFADWFAKKPLTDLERYKAMEAIVDTVSHNSSLINAKNPYERIPAIIGRMSDCKREGKTMEELLRVADAYDAEMAGKSKEGTKADKKNRLQSQKFRDFIDLFRRYQSMLEERGAYDYDDMILVALAVLAEEDDLLAAQQERYQYILVDEAQDLNGAQWKVIERLTTSAVSPNDPNFFLVGDDDQAIYRFQGANVEHMLAFRERFPAAPVIVLTENYRSTQPILDAAGRLIAHNEERLVGRIPGLRKDLHAATNEEGAPPVLLRPPSDAAEPWCMADMIVERLKLGIPAQDIAILVQKNSELRPIYDVLRARGIPVVLSGKEDLLSHAIVGQVMQILRFMESPTDDRLFHALPAQCFHCHPADLARLSFASRDSKKRALELLVDIEQSDLPWIDRDALIRARDILLALAQKHEQRTVLESVEHALRTSGISAEAHTLDPIDLAVVETFFQYVKQRCFERPSLSLYEFMRDLSFYAQEDYGQVRLTYQIPHLVADGVQLMTAHQSKGLEFHTVFLSNFCDGHWDERSNPTRLALPEHLLFGWETDQKKFEQHQDERRLAYVAMTRAKRELCMLCPKEIAVGERVRSVSPSAFFAQAGPLPEADIAVRNPEQSSLLLVTPSLPDDALDVYLRERLGQFALSPSSLTQFLRDPLEFRRTTLLGQPEEFSEKSLRALGYGSAAHWALRAWAEARMKSQEFSVGELLEAFRWHLYERNVLTEKQRTDLLAQGNESLTSYFRSVLEGKTPFIYAVERDYRAHLGDIPLKGKIDRIDLASATSGDAIVIDYKTGRPKAPGEIRGNVEPGKISRTAEGEYFRQLVFYALLLEQSDPLLQPQSYILEFVGERSEEPISRAFTVSEQEKDDLRELIRLVWAKIIALDFTPL